VSKLIALNSGRKKTFLFMSFLVMITAVGVGARMIPDGKIRVAILTIEQSPATFFGKDNPDLRILPKEKEQRVYKFVYRSRDWFSNYAAYLQKHPEDAVVISATGGSDSEVESWIFSNNRPDNSFFRLNSQS
jgi:hypothetical protein